MTQQPPSREVLAAFALDPGEGIVFAVRTEPDGVWNFRTEDARYVLCRYSPLRSEESVGWEHELLARLSHTEWPVAAPVKTSHGPTAVSTPSGQYALFPASEGSPLSPRSLTAKRIAGRLLARLHEEFASLPAVDQRPGSGHSWELDLLIQPSGAQTFNQLARKLGEGHWELASAIRRQRCRNLRKLSRQGYGELPARIVHSDFHTENRLFSDGQLTGLLGFEGAHVDAPVFDVAAGISKSCLLSARNSGFDLEAAQSFLGGYRQHRTLDSGEVKLIPALVRAHLLWLVASQLAEWHVGRSDQIIERLATVMENQFPALDDVASHFGALALA